MALSPAYTTETAMRRFFSAAGVDAFADHDMDGDADSGVVEDCIDQATDEINMYAMQHYAAEAIATSTLAIRWATVIACYHLCTRRGNPPPESLEKEFLRITALLERVEDGDLKLPGIPYRDDTRPTVSNMVIDRRYRFNRARVEVNSSTNAPGQLHQNEVELNGGVHLP